MERYGDRPEDFDDQDSEVLDHLNIEQLVQTLATFRRSQINMHVVQKLEWQLSRLCHEILPADEAREIDKAAMKPRHIPIKGGVVQVMIVEARNLPKMDLLRSIDPYVLIFCASNIDGANTTGAVSFKTETKKKNRNPVWDEECEIPLVGSVNMLTATIFDADDMSSDDLVGCVHVHLHDLDPGVEVDDWYDIVNPKMNPERLKTAQIHLKITYLPMIDGMLVSVRTCRSLSPSQSKHACTYAPLPAHVTGNHKRLRAFSPVTLSKNRLGFPAPDLMARSRTA
jgi:hypothetical protein